MKPIPRLSELRPRTSKARDVAVAQQSARQAFFQAVLAACEGAVIRLPPEFPDFAARRLFIGTKTSEVVQFEVNSLQRRYLLAKHEALARKRAARFVVLKFRRGGITTIEQGLSYYAATTRPNTTVATLAHTEKSTKAIAKIARLMLERDPERPRLRGRGDAAPFEFSDLNSSFIVGTAGGRAFGRGDTLHRVHGSEVSRWFEKRGDQIALQQDLISGLTEAASHGEVVLESTAKGFEYFEFLYGEGKRGQGDWTSIFLPWFHDATNSIPLEAHEARELMGNLDDAERHLVARHGLEAGAIAWRRWKKSQPEMIGLFEQEYPEDDASCFKKSGTPYFAFDLESILDATPETEPTPMVGGHAFVWEAPAPGVRYVAGGDTSEGLPNGDYAVLGIMRADTGVQVACIRGRWGVSETAKHFSDWCKRYNSAFLGVESENTGHAVIAKLKELGYSGTSRLYSRNVGRDRFGAIKTPDMLREGWSTNAQTRPTLLADLSEAVATGAMGVRDRVLLVEMTRFNLQASGRYEADSGAHDDSIFAWGIAWQMRSVPRGRMSVLAIEL